MLKISLLDCGGSKATLRLEGRVAGPWVGELRQACEKTLGEGRPVELDLAGVSFVDAGGVVLLTHFKSLGISLIDCSPFVSEQLKNSQNQDA